MSPEKRLPAHGAAFLEGSLVRLRPLEHSDLTERYLGWLNDPEVTRYTEAGTFPSTREDLENFYRSVTGSKNDVMLAIVDRASGRHIGNVKLGPIHWIHRTATLGILIGEKEFWGKGVGLEATRLMVEYGFERLNLHRIDLGVFAEHEAAVRCYEKAGFKIEGRMREDLFQDGRHRDRLWMGLLRSEYKPLKGEAKKNGKRR
ncbi:MAG TPA: GNAT family protein [Verrucomicrobiae bacterium]|nr:GNAT family protein [Verrucomicrobiae bacterium]